MIEQKYPTPKSIEFSKDGFRPFDIVGLTDDFNGLTIAIRFSEYEEHKYRFHEVFGYRNLDEADRHYGWKEIGGYLRCGFYETESSEFLDWIKRQSIHQEIPDQLRHFMIVSSNDVLDVAAYEAPIIVKNRS